MRVLLLWLLAVLAAPVAAQISGGVVKLGVLTDLGGPYSITAGQGSILATRMAIADCMKAECAGLGVEMISADHQNKPDIGLSLARRWFDQEGVDAVVDVSHAAIQAGMQGLVAEKNKVALYAGGSNRITEEDCRPDHSVSWMWDIYASVNSVVNSVAKPGSKWFLVVPDYVFGRVVEREVGTALAGRGAALAGTSRSPFPAQDFSSQLLTAVGTKPDVVAFGHGGSDLALALRQAREYRVDGPERQIAAYFLLLNDVHAMGLEAAGGAITAEGFHWDLDEETRQWSRRFMAEAKRMPSVVHAGLYSAVLHYLKAVAAAKSDDAKRVTDTMRKLPIRDPVVRNARLREDGRMVHDYYLLTVKTPAESKYPWDYFRLVATIRGDEAFKPVNPAACTRLAR